MPVFPPVPAHASFPEVEERVLDLWKQNDTFERSVAQRPDSKHYVFYDGPPFATGLPHYGHLVASTLKDIVPRYWTMRGYRVERRFGWDTHGLPIEMLVEKKLGLSGPSSIREFGVAEFNETCRANVLEYTAEWEKVVGRLGRWVDFRDDYKTMDASFMESVWWVFRRLWDEGLVYRGFRVMPYSWRLSTSLSNFEANLDYRNVQDPAIVVTLPLVDGSASLLVWTTTPWTLPSNLACAVGSDVDYVEARREGDDTVYIVAEARLADQLGKDATVLRRFKGAELVGKAYEPLFTYFSDHPNAFQVIASGHVSADDGTGLVHMAPDFGEDDYNACLAVGIDVLESVDDEGRFRESVTDFAGRNVKEADPDIISWLKEAGRLYSRGTIQHEYPYCWRSGTPLIYKAVPAWFVKVTELRDRMVEHNKTIRWVPEAVGSKRFGNWLADARDWNISRNRFWGTPIPIWECEACEERVCVGSISELQERAGAEVTDLHPHKIDHLTMTCAGCGAPMKRITDVFDCWFESGSMPYAQSHYPFENRDRFEANFPAEFIAEGLDQTRGWFYTLLVLSTALFDKPPFQSVIVNGMVLAEDGSKMSKSKQNYPPPDRIFDTYGADALRAYLIDSPIVRAEPLRFSEGGVKQVARTVLIPLQNALSFFVQYANIDDWSPAQEAPALADRPELDRWILSMLQSLVREVNEQMEAYRLDKVVGPLVGFIDHLTNWYIRLSRRRFWKSDDDVDKASAYATLYEVLVTFAKVIAPFLPFLAEEVYQTLVVRAGAEGPDSVHLCDYPEVELTKIDADLEQRVDWTRQVVYLGRRLREVHRLKTRQPLARVTVVNHDAEVCAAVREHAELIEAELNVKDVAVRADDTELATLSFKPNFKRLGRRYGKQMRDAAAVITGLTAEDWATLSAGGTLDVLGQDITAEDVLVQRSPRGDVVIETQGGMMVALDTELTEALVAEGLVREVTTRVNRLRKDGGLAVTDRIRLTLATDDAVLRAALEERADWIAQEVLATALEVRGELDGEALDIEGRALTAQLVVA